MFSGSRGRTQSRFALFLAVAPAVLSLLLLALSARADVPAIATSMDIAPTLIRLEPGKPGLFYVSNRGAAPLMVEIRPMDWSQREGRDDLVPSTTLFTSPPIVTIAPGARQSVRLLARRAGAYRLLVSELPDPNDDAGRVKVMLQFSVPVFVGEMGAPRLSWRATRDGDVVRLHVANTGAAPVKLRGAQLGGVALAEGPLYLLAGAARAFIVRAPASLRVTGEDMLSGRPLDADAQP